MHLATALVNEHDLRALTVTGTGDDLRDAYLDHLSAWEANFKNMSAEVPKVDGHDAEISASWTIFTRTAQEADVTEDQRTRLDKIVAG